MNPWQGRGGSAQCPIERIAPVRCTGNRHNLPSIAHRKLHAAVLIGRTTRSEDLREFHFGLGHHVRQPPGRRSRAQQDRFAQLRAGDRIGFDIQIQGIAPVIVDDSEPTQQILRLVEDNSRLLLP